MASTLADHGGKAPTTRRSAGSDRRSGPMATWYTAEEPMFGKRMRVISPPTEKETVELRLSSVPRRAYRSLTGPVMNVLGQPQPLRGVPTPGWGRKVVPVLLLAGVLAAGCIGAAQAVTVFRASWQSTDTSLYTRNTAGEYRPESGTIPGPFAPLDSVWKGLKERWTVGRTSTASQPSSPQP